MADMTAADIAAVTRNDGYGDGMYGGWFWIIIILFAFMNNGWNNNGYNDVARESTMNAQFTQRDIAGVNQNVFGSTQTLQNSICGVKENVLNTKYDLANQIMENKYVNQLAEAETQKQILLGNSNLQKDMLLGNANIISSQDRCCCEIKNLIREDGEKTRAMINENIIQSLRDKVADKDRELLSTGLSYGTTITANNVEERILGKLGNYYPKVGVNPINVYSTGCGCNL